MAALWTILLALGVGTLLVTQGGEAAFASMLAGAQEAVTLCLSLAGAYLLFCGLTGVAKRAGLMEALSRALKKPVGWLFPDAGEAAGPIALAFSANMLGLGNAATPLGLEAMRALDKNNPVKGTASPAMWRFVAVNASALQLLPAGILALRTSYASRAPGDVLLPALCADAAAMLTAVLLCKLISRP